MKTPIITFLILLPFTLFAQDRWTFEMYEEVNLNNFNKNQLFKEKVDFSNVDIPRLDAAIFYLTNQRRKKKRRTELSYHKILEISAYHHSKSMAKKKFFSHTNKKQRKRRKTVDRAKLAGATNPAYAENIAYDYIEDGETTYMEAAEMLVDMWMKSKGHRKNILSKDALQMGCGVYLMKDGRLYGTQNFQWFTKLKDSGNAVDKLPALMRE